MLLRSPSTPVFKSPEAPPRLSVSVSLSPDYRPHVVDSVKKTSQSDLKGLSKAKTKLLSNGHPNFVILDTKKQEKQVALGLISKTISLDRWLLNPGSDESLVAEEDEECALLAGSSGGGGMISSGGGGGGGGGDSGDEYSGSSHGFEGTDEYYQKMIKANPGNPLLLGNYARFLKEVRGDIVKAEEYCGRAIVGNANDGNVFSLYGELIWHAHRDGRRAHCYFDQAVQAAPQDCYVLASYARFLWDAEDEDEGKEKDEKQQHEINITSASPTSFFQGFAAPPPHVAASS
ncbi:hypothetical protein F0562_007320 [Nyssa sinensis]|uniref:Uncharacterized protein n=1 Tax=Nyssa sinensis TaxID=561372 RepID=A0A5J5A320_9ASTE|nr:hypothetical protein F0562_007320 [Nyssa sinensis]